MYFKIVGALLRVSLSFNFKLVKVFFFSVELVQHLFMVDLKLI